MIARLLNMKRTACLLAAIVLALSLIPSIASADDSHDPLGKVPDLKRVSAYTDEEIARATDLLVKGTLTKPPGTELAGKSIAPDDGPPMPGRPDSLGVMLIDTSAGYQLYGPEEYGKPDRTGGATAETYAIPHLVDNEGEWMVLHQWGKRVDTGEGTENCIVVWRNGNTATFKFYVSSLGGYQHEWSFPADHTFHIGVQAQHETGGTEYTRVFFWVWDLTNQTEFSRIYEVPQTERINCVDAALEQFTTTPANNLWVLQLSRI